MKNNQNSQRSDCVRIKQRMHSSTKLLAWPIWLFANLIKIKLIPCHSCLYHAALVLFLTSALCSQSSKYFIYLTSERLFIPVHLLCGFSSTPVRGGQGSRQRVERAGWVRGFEFMLRVEDCVFPKKTGAVIWVEVMVFSAHADRIGGSVGGESSLETKWTKSSWSECSSAYTRHSRMFSSSNKVLGSKGMFGSF